MLVADWELRNSVSRVFQERPLSSGEATLRNRSANDVPAAAACQQHVMSIDFPGLYLFWDVSGTVRNRDRALGGRSGLLRFQTRAEGFQAARLRLIDHPHRPLPDFRGISRRPVYDSILSRNGVSGKAGAIH